MCGALEGGDEGRTPSTAFRPPASAAIHLLLTGHLACRSSFEETHMSNRLSDADIREANLAGACLDHADPTRAGMQRAQLRKASLIAATFVNRSCKARI